MITMESLRPVEVIRNGTEYLCSSPAWCVCVCVHVHVRVCMYMCVCFVPVLWLYFFWSMAS